ncbi:DNA N6-methyl adenine demethylase-like [Rhagoletis pomonella]|uniref:DNA N6-methyl adenine demethylase-like n=1 Tax=Rhagoletis pomonella TaxID=28610 RepID=UPI0017807DB4|nr:DNA N6-methyl adenine demethylase-like [Rhagoletis pomonella]
MDTKDHHSHSSTLKSAGLGNGGGNGPGNGREHLGGAGGFEPFSKLPSFQSQFHGYNDPLMSDGIAAMASSVLPPSMSSLQTVAMSPASISVSSPGMVSVGSPLTQLSGLQASITPPSSATAASSFAPLGAPPPPNTFHHLGAVNTHGHHRSSASYAPLMPTNTGAMGSYGSSGALDDGRHHLPLYQALTPTYATPPAPSALAPISSQHTLGGLGGIGAFSGVGKKDTTQTYDLNNGNGGLTLSAATINTANTNVTPMGMHTPTTPSYVDGSGGVTMMDTSNGASGYHTPHSTHAGSSSGAGAGASGPHTPHTPHTTQPHTPTPSTTTQIKVEKVLNSPIARVDARKKERRKNRANSLESSAESEASAMDVDPSNPGQVDAVSSTANFKSPLSALGMGDSNDTNSDKQSKKKRKRCGECIGCQRKDNCGECAPCRNDKSHQICKQRRCEKLTEKKEPKAKQVCNA